MANNIFGGNGGGKPEDSGDKPQVTDAGANAAATTSPSTGEGQPDAQVTDLEAASLDGAGGPNRTPAFGKQDFRDENVQLTDTDDLQSLKTGAAASSARPDLDMAGLEAAAAAGEEQEGKVQYTSTPIAALRVGSFQFEGGLLSLSNEDAEKFEKLLKATDVRTQNTVRKIDREGGEAIAKQFRTLHGGTTTGVDTSTNGSPSPQPRAEG